jgi:multidrug resistance protein, MATE family
MARQTALTRTKARMPASFFSSLHTRETVSLAWPLIITQVGHIITGMVDNIFLGAIGPTEQAAGILSNNLFVLVLVFAIGMSYAATPLVTGAYERNLLVEKASLFKHSLILNFVVALLCFAVLYSATPLLAELNQPADVVELAQPFFGVLVFSMIPISFFFTCKQYCEGLSNTRLALIISIAGNVINIILNYFLIYGKFGLPALGYIGSAWASFFARLFMGLAFLFLVLNTKSTKEIAGLWMKVPFELRTFARLWKIGINSALQFTFEVAAFAIAGLMAGRFGKEQIDAHGIALSIASFTYMFGSGIGSAATIRVGIRLARGDWPDIKAAAFTALKLAALVMGGFAVCFLLFHSYLPQAFSGEENILRLAASLLIIAAVFQVFDGLQVTLIGILRGLEDVKVPTVVTLVGYWLVALPLAYFFAFTLKLETEGVWIGLLVSLVFVAVCLMLRLRYLLNKNLAASGIGAAGV